LRSSRELAGHVDIRTTQIYVDVTDQRKADGITALEQATHPGTQHQGETGGSRLSRER